MHPYVAILRGLEPAKAVDVSKVLYDAGFRTMEVPLNSPEPLKSIEKIKNYWNDKLIIGAGTVLSKQDVTDVYNAGGTLIVSPNCQQQVIEETKRLQMISAPGVMTVTEAFAALSYGADFLKLFPCEAISPPVVKAYRAVLPKDSKLIAVGGINEQNMNSYIQAGVQGFGFGSSLFQPSLTLQEIQKRAQNIFKFK